MLTISFFPRLIFITFPASFSLSLSLLASLQVKEKKVLCQAIEKALKILQQTTPGTSTFSCFFTPNLIREGYFALFCNPFIPFTRL
jgi:hypothetical protein